MSFLGFAQATATQSLGRWVQAFPHLTSQALLRFWSASWVITRLHKSGPRLNNRPTISANLGLIRITEKDGSTLPTHSVCRESAKAREHYEATGEITLRSMEMRLLIRKHLTTLALILVLVA